MKLFWIRTVSALVYAGLTALSIFAGWYWFSIFIVLIVVLCLVEFSSLFIEKRNQINFVLPNLTAFALFLGCVVVTLSERFVMPALLAMLFLLFLNAILFIGKKVTMISLGVAASSVFYILTPLFFVILLGQAFSDKPWLIFAFFVFNWLNDTMAYIVGSLVGKTKILPEISPGKSWEGFFGGLAFTVFAAAIFWYYLRTFELQEWVVLGAITTLAATLGDFFESALKRFMHLKDSGKLMPGHGGVLDRFDGILFSAPVYFFILLFLQR
ncbi:MAG: phosphatidate cytidylyltransferase [Bacteroidetes bacterium]|nr:phosphatidate cytidylyltransferase [Bacteroidota bacterium]MBU1717832.1 phosphatidate cytidylyltransferase [Bacteroidota bacterium]